MPTLPFYVPPQMRVECAWCGVFMSSIACAPGQEAQVSHGICPPCALAQLRDLEPEHFTVPPAVRLSCSPVLRHRAELSPLRARAA